MKKTAEEIRIEFIEFCRQIGIYTKKESMKKAYNISDKYYEFEKQELGEYDESCAAVISPLLDHEDEYIKDRAARYCYICGYEKERCLEILNYLHENAEDRCHRADVYSFLYFNVISPILPSNCQKDTAPVPSAKESKTNSSKIRKYYCVLEGTHVERLDNGSFDETHYDGKYLTKYAEEIQNLFDKHTPNEGIEEYLGMWTGVSKVDKATLHTEVKGDTLWACFTVLLNDTLTEENESSLYSAIEGQTYSGIGESIMGSCIKTAVGDMFISIWRNGDKLLTEGEFLKI